MNRVNLLVFSAIALLALFQGILRPYLIKKSSSKTLHTVLDLWKARDVYTALDYWQRPEKCPPIYNLIAYKIKNQQFKRVNRKNYSFFYVYLEFEKNNPLPSESEWLFVLRDVEGGWKIIDFGVSHLDPSDYPKLKGRYDPMLDQKRLKDFAAGKYKDEDKNNLNNPDGVIISDYPVDSPKNRELEALPASL